MPRPHTGDSSSEKPLHRLAPPIVLSVALLLYLAATVPYLGTWPPVHQDEPWIASFSHTLATTGVLASPVFAGYAGSEIRLISISPLHHMTQAAVLSATGLGLAEVRLLSVVCGAILLLLIYLLGRALFDERTALLATLLTGTLTLTNASIGIGIPIMDISRIGRADSFAAIFCVGGLYLFESIDRGSRPVPGYLLAGLVMGLGAITHPVAFMSAPAILVVLLRRRGIRALIERDLYIVALGFILPIIPVGLHVAAHWDEFLPQMRNEWGRFGFTSPSFYVSNLLGEYRRYGVLGIQRLFGPDPIRPGIIAALLLLPSSALCALGNRTMRSSGQATAALILMTEGTFLALFIRQKFFSYTIALLPFVLLLIAWGGLRIWDRRRAPGVRAALVVLLAAIFVEGGLHIASDRRMAAAATPYAEYVARIRSAIPPGARVLGLQHYWMGMAADYRTWLVPIYLTTPGITTPPLPLDAAIERVDPDVILIDTNMREYFMEIADSANPRHRQWIELERWRGRHPTRLLRTIDDPTYGRMEVLAVERP